MDWDATFCERLLSLDIAQSPNLANLESFLRLPPTTKMPILPELFDQLSSSLKTLFISAHGVLARAFGNSIFPSPYGTISGNPSEHFTVSASWRPPLPLYAL
jgi:hypothetical protein